MLESSVLSPPEVARGNNRDSSADHDVAAAVQRRLRAECPYAFCYRDVTFEYADGVLTIRGRVPSFYLRQVLISFVRELDQIAAIDDQLDVVSSTGLSSVRWG